MPLIDVDIAGKGRREVTAYMSTFNDPYRVVDDEGDYDESIRSTAWNRTLAHHGINAVRVMFNHGLTIWRTPSDKWSNPIGAPIDIRPDTRGMITVTRYNETVLGDEALEMWRNGDVRAQSWRGAKIDKVIGRRGDRKLIERTELGLVEYGPAIIPANDNATLVSMRSALLADQVAGMPPEERAHLLQLLSESDTQDTALEAPVDGPPDEEEDTPPPEEVKPDPSLDLLLKANANRRRRHSQGETPS